jgi:hypothetical protein
MGVADSAGGTFWRTVFSATEISSRESDWFAAGGAARVLAVC